MKEKNEQGYTLFTEEMRESYTILAPSMLPIHFALIAQIMKNYGYNIVFCEGNRNDIIQEGLRCTHNDICYPAMLVVGQMMSELKSGKYDQKHIALMMTQTGGGCRASNYIHLIRKALKNNRMEEVPVISVSLNQMENHPGFKITIGLAVKLIMAMFYGDLLMFMFHQCKPYEIVEGSTERKIDEWVERLVNDSNRSKYMHTKKVYRDIVEDFATLPRKALHKPKVGIVGEIYMKYSPLGNNYLEEYLMKEGVEVVMSGLSDFIMYCLSNTEIDLELYGARSKSTLFSKIGYHFMHREQLKLIDVMKTQGVFRAPTDFKEVKALGESYVGLGVKMGEGWLLTAEMIELIEQGVNNIVCAQPFGCLPNHIVGKGMMRKIKEHYAHANITAIDFDPSESKVNQENRIKLMLANSQVG